jgi:hypothetical protein
VVLNSIQENDFHGAFEALGITIFVPEETIFKEMIAEIE